MENRKALYVAIFIIFIFVAIFATSIGMFTQNTGILNPSFEEPMNVGWVIVNSDTGVSAEQSSAWVSSGELSLRLFGTSTKHNNIDITQSVVLGSRVESIVVDLKSDSSLEPEGHRIGLCIYKPNERCIFSPERNEPALGSTGTYTLTLNVPEEYRQIPAKLVLRTTTPEELDTSYYWDNVRTI